MSLFYLDGVCLPNWPGIGLLVNNESSLPTWGLSLGRLGQERLDVFLSVAVIVHLGAAVQSSPLGILLEQAHRVDVLSQANEYLDRSRASGERTLVSSVVKRW